jgi:putative sigma-54 modulation protein
VDIIVKGKNCDVPPRLKEEAVSRVEHATRFFDRLLGVEMVFSEEHNPRIPEPAVVEVTARTKGHHIRAEGAAADHRDAIDVALTRFERQLARYKTRLVDRRRRGHPVPAAGNGPALLPSDFAPEPQVPAVEPLQIVRRKSFALSPMLPEDAAWQLELLGHDFYLFTNAASGRCSVVYRRRDGQLGLIEAAEEEGAPAADGA